jgi:hypothetical protein
MSQSPKKRSPSPTYNFEQLSIPAGLPVDIYRHINSMLYGYIPEKHTPDYMAETNNLAGVESIVEHKQRDAAQINDAFQSAVKYGRLKMAKYLVSQGANVTLWDNAALVEAVTRGDLKMVKFLVLNAVNVNEPAYSPFLIAAGNGNIPMVEYIISQGGDAPPHVINMAIRMCAYYGHLDMIRYLITRGGCN